MTEPYTEALRAFQGIILRGDKHHNTLEQPTPIAKVDARLRELGAKTVGDFYAACGFHKFLIRNEEKKVNYLEVEFSSRRYGENPISVR